MVVPQKKTTLHGVRTPGRNEVTVTNVVLVCLESLGARICHAFMHFTSCYILMHLYAMQYNFTCSHICIIFASYIYTSLYVCLRKIFIYHSMIDSFISCECTGGQHPSLDKPMLAIRTPRLNSRNDRTLTTLARAHLWLGSLSWIRTIGPLMKVRSCLM